MTVFKGYMKILKKNIGLVIIYLVIFFSVAMALQAAASKEHLEDFEKARVDIAVADNDQSTLSHALTDYLKTIHNVSEISSDPLLCRKSFFTEMQNILYRFQKISIKLALYRITRFPSQRFPDPILHFM